MMLFRCGAVEVPQYVSADFSSWRLFHHWTYAPAGRKSATAANGSTPFALGLIDHPHADVVCARGTRIRVVKVGGDYEAPPGGGVDARRGEGHVRAAASRRTRNPNGQQEIGRAAAYGGGRRVVELDRLVRHGRVK